MSFDEFKLIMAGLALTLVMLVLVSLRAASWFPAVSFPRLKLPAINMRCLLAQSGHSRTQLCEEAEAIVARRARALAGPRLSAEPGKLAPGPPETFLDQAMLNLEHAFESFAAGRIGSDTFRSLVITVRRVATRRLAGLSAHQELAAGQDVAESGKRPDVIAALEAAEWCLNWIDEYEQLRNVRPEPAQAA